MTKQEFLAFSLPYKLFFRIEYGSTNQPIGIYQMSGVYETSVVEGFNYDNNVKTDKLKPILHPLTDLTKEIEHNGKKFVPIMKLYGGDDYSEYDYTIEVIHRPIIGDAIRIYVKNAGEINFGLKYPLRNMLTFDSYQQLIEWHFDLFNGIESGEAIDVNTLSENPYK